MNARGYLVYWGIRVAEFIVANLPAKITWPLFVWAARRNSKKDTRQMRTVRANMNRASGRTLSKAELDELVTKAFISYAGYWHTLLRLSKIDSNRVGSDTKVEGREFFDKAVASDRGVILALPHMGNWDLAAAWLHGIGEHVSVVAEVLEPPAMFDWFCRTREGFGNPVIPLNSEAAATLSSLLRKGETVGLLCDRDITADGVEVNFFGETTTIPGGPALLAIRNDAILLPVSTYSSLDGELSLVFDEPIEISRSESIRADVRTHSQELVNRFEKLISRAPEQWHVFQPNWPAERG